MYPIHGKSFIGGLRSVFRCPKVTSPVSSLINRKFHIGHMTHNNYHHGKQKSKSPSFDYIIVGAGSAGCVLANRLLDNGTDTVNLIEAGPNDKTWKIHMPAAFIKNLSDDKYNWYYKTKPQINLNNREINIPRGRVIGGSSSLNFMVYIRGHPYDYDGWNMGGAKGWSYAHCLPYFKRSESHEFGESLYRGGNGPLHVGKSKIENVLHKVWVEAGKQAGYGYTDDMNGIKQEGFGYTDYTIHNGERWSSSKAYLRPVLSNKNLTITTEALVTKVLFDGKRAVGVEFINKNGEINKATANREVILSSGAINSPQILMLSGVGDADELRKHSINVVEHVSGVGKNLQDHTFINIGYRCQKPISLYSSHLLHNEIRILLQWVLFKTGLGTSPNFNSMGFIRSEINLTHPDIQYVFLPDVTKDFGQKIIKTNGFQVCCIRLRSHSKGNIKLNSNNPRQHPIIDPNYNSVDHDLWVLRQAIKFGREIFSQPAFDEFRGDELFPGININSDSKINEYIRNFESTAFHQSSTCKMGSSNNNDTVTDPNCRVVGVENLRVVDASIMPNVISGNLNAPVIMIAEKASDMILGRNPLPAMNNVPIWKPENQLKQR